jgi:hypothetical protein
MDILFTGLVRRVSPGALLRVARAASKRFHSPPHQVAGLNTSCGASGTAAIRFLWNAGNRFSEQRCDAAGANEWDERCRGVERALGASCSNCDGDISGDVGNGARLLEEDHLPSEAAHEKRTKRL